MTKKEFLKKVLQKIVPIPDGTPKKVRNSFKKHRRTVMSRLKLREMSTEKLKAIIEN